MKIKEFDLNKNLLPTSISLSQVYTGGLEYAPINEENELLTAFVTCKDYFNDLIYSITNGKKVDIYGVSVDPSKENFNTKIDKLRVAIRIKGDKDFEKLMVRMGNAINLINDHFKRLKFEKVKIVGIGNFEFSKSVIINMPSDFTIMPPLMSAFLLYLRAGLGYDRNNELSKTPEDYIKNVGKIKDATTRSSDPDDLKHSMGLIEKIIGQGKDKVFTPDYKLNYNEKWQIYTVHNSLGIRSYMQMHSSKDKLYHECIK